MKFTSQSYGIGTCQEMCREKHGIGQDVDWPNVVVACLQPLPARLANILPADSFSASDVCPRCGSVPITVKVANPSCPSRLPMFEHAKKVSVMTNQDEFGSLGWQLLESIGKAITQRADHQMHKVRIDMASLSDD